MQLLVLVKPADTAANTLETLMNGAARSHDTLMHVTVMFQGGFALSAHAHSASVNGLACVARHLQSHPQSARVRAPQSQPGVQQHCPSVQALNKGM